MGGAVVALSGAALYSGLKKEPLPCSLCQGTGGVKCFGCAGDGKRVGYKADREGLGLNGMEGPPERRDMLGRSVNPRECNVCKGAGLVLCSQCKGSGYQSTF